MRELGFTCITTGGGGTNERSMQSYLLLITFQLLYSYTLTLLPILLHTSYYYLPLPSSTYYYRLYTAYSYY